MTSSLLSDKTAAAAIRRFDWKIIWLKWLICQQRVGIGFLQSSAEQRVQTLRAFESFTSLFYSKPSRRAWDFCDLLNFCINTNESLQWASNMLFSQHGFIAGQLDPSSFWQVIHFLHQYCINSDLSILHLKLDPSKDYYIGKISGRGGWCIFMRNSLAVSFMMSSKPQFSGASPNTTPHLATLLSPCCILPVISRKRQRFSFMSLWAVTAWKWHRKGLQNSSLRNLPRGRRQWYILIKKNQQQNKKSQTTCKTYTALVPSTFIISF